MKRIMTLLLAAVLTAALWTGTPLPVQAANEFTPDIVCQLPTCQGKWACNSPVVQAPYGSYL